MPDAEAEEARIGLVEEKGFFILPSELFCNVRKAAPQDENLNETLETVFRHIEESAKGSESESSFAGLFDDYDVNSNKLGATVAKRNEKLVKLLNGVAEQEEADLAEIISTERLRPVETRKFMGNAFRDGTIKTTGTDIDKLMPPVSRFGGGNRAEKKRGVVEKLKALFEKYFGLGIAEFSDY